MEHMLNLFAGIAAWADKVVDRVTEKTGFAVLIPEGKAFAFVIGNRVMDVAAGPTRYYKSPLWTVGGVIDLNGYVFCLDAAGKEGLRYIITTSWEHDPNNLLESYRHAKHMESNDPNWLKTLCETTLRAVERDMTAATIVEDSSVLRNRLWAGLRQKVEPHHIDVTQVTLRIVLPQESP